MSVLSPARDHRIDFFRGLALIMIFINHVPDTVLGSYTTRNFGFSDAAEAFVLLSGISAGLAYGPVKTSGPNGQSVLQPWKRAFTLWWVQAVIVISIFLMLAATQHLPGVAEMAAERNVTPVLENPMGLLGPLLLLTHQFNCADILPLYILLLLATPGLIAIAWRWPRALILGSALLWFAAGWHSVNVRTWPTDHGWYFNPLSWQFLFIAGLLIGLAKSRGKRLLPTPLWAIVLVALFILVSALWMQIPALADRGDDAIAHFQDRLGTPQFLTSLDKTYLAPLRLLHIFALAYALGVWPLLHRIARSRWATVVTVLGRNALPVFAVSSVLGYLIQIIREVSLSSDLMDVGLISIGINVMLLTALLKDRARQRASHKETPATD